MVDRPFVTIGDAVPANPIPAPPPNKEDAPPIKDPADKNSPKKEGE